jgi:TrmH family RNA methyltransferase
MDTITSKTNTRIKGIRKLRSAKGRKDQARALVEGPTLVETLIASRIPIELVVCDEDDVIGHALSVEAGGEALTVTREVFESISDTATPQSPLAIIAVPPRQPLRAHDTLVLVDIADPGNVGTMIRSAYAFGWDVAIGGSAADPWSPKTIRSSAGAVFSVHLSDVTDAIADPAAAGLRTYALVVRGGEQPRRDHNRVALIVGSEARGLDDAVVRRADTRTSIEMPGGTESLNAGVAAAVAMYALGVRD